VPTVLTVEHQDFTFDDQWQVLKYDDCADYARLEQGTDGSNAVDLLGSHGDWLFLIEVKDYRIQGQKMSHAELATWVAMKVRDTIAGVVGFQRTSAGPDLWRLFMRDLRNQDGKLMVVLFVEDYELNEQVGNRWKPKATVIRDLLRTKMKWLRPEVNVFSQSNHSVPGLTVTTKAGAAGHKGRK
jgi:hypothetical protein